MEIMKYIFDNTYILVFVIGILNFLLYFISNLINKNNNRDIKNLIPSLIYNIILFLLSIIVLVFYKKIKEELFIYLLAIYFILLVVSFIYNTLKIYYTSNTKISRYNLITNSLKENKLLIYFIIDEKDRIKDISDSFLEQLGLKYEEVINKNIYDIFNKTIRITSMNNVEINNKTYKEYYKKNKRKKEELEVELHFKNHLGEDVILKLLEKPILNFKKYNGKISIGEIKGDLNLLHIEKKLNDTDNELEELRNRFISTLEITNDNLFFIDLNEKYIWATDKYIDTFNLPANTINLEDFHKLIYQDDLNNYLNTLNNLTKVNKKYKVKYRFLYNNDYVWVVEEGLRIFENNSSTIVGYTKILNNDFFENTGLSLLDNIKGEIDLLKDIGELLQNNHLFDFVLIKLTNIPEINEKYSRQVGNMMIVDYLEKLKTTFSSDNFKMYRVSGLEFVLIITDIKKIEIFRKIMKNDDHALDLKVQYGSVDEIIEVKVGVSRSINDALDAKSLFLYARKALKVASSQGYNKSICFYSDIS